MTPPITAQAVDAELTTLLAGCDLPTSDLVANALVRLYGGRIDGELVGVVGFEPFGQVALLRSLAVAPSQRGKGLGQALVASAEAHATAQGIDSLYLLTTTAAAFFARLGYTTVERALAPAAIRATRQFAGLCPAAATLMCKRLSP
jgi:amino-acid N-acetyltransferase